VTAAGVTAFDASDAGLVPTELRAVTVNVYSTPLVSPLTMQLVAIGVVLLEADDVHDAPAGDDVAV
jgi:hypothetical protein